jgi:hypothetical protein
VALTRGREQATIYTDDRNDLLSAVHRLDEPLSATELSEAPQHSPAVPVQTRKRPGFLRGPAVFGGRGNPTQPGLGSESMNDRGLDHAG